MDFRTYLIALRRNALVIIALVVIGAAAALGLASIKPLAYTATAEMFVSSTGSSNVNDFSTGSSVAQAVAQDYAELALTPYVLGPAARAVGGGASADELESELSTSVVQDTGLIQLSVTDASPQRAARIANAVGDQVTLRAAQLNRTSDNGGRFISVTRVRTATSPTTSTSAPIVTQALIGALVGLLLGLGFAALRELLSTRLRSPEDVQHAWQAPLLATTTYRRALAAAPLVTEDSALGATVEEFRFLRTSINYLRADAAPSAMTVLSASAGEGKSSTLLNLALTMAAYGQRVVVVDADFRRPRVHEYLRIDGSVGLSDVLTGRVPLDAAMQSWRSGEIVALPAGHVPPNPGVLLESTAMAELVEQLRGRFDVVLVDSPPLLAAADGAVVAKVLDGAIVVSSARRASRPEAERAAAVLVRMQVEVLGVVISMQRARESSVSAYSGYEAVPSAEVALRTRVDSGNDGPTPSAAGDLDAANGAIDRRPEVGARAGRTGISVGHVRRGISGRLIVTPATRSEHGLR